MTQPLADLIEVHGLPQIEIDPKQTPPDVSVKLVVGGRPEEVMTLDQFRVEWPVLRTAFQVAQDLHDAANPGGAGELRVGPTFEELLDVAQRYLDGRTRTLDGAEPAAWESTSGAGRSSTCWRRPSAALATVDLPPSPCSAIRNGSIQPGCAGFGGPASLAAGRKCHTNRAPCHTDLEKQFADFLDRSKDVVRWFRNKRLGFSVTYQPDFLVISREADGREVLWAIETKGEIRSNTKLKSQAAEIWWQRMSTTRYGSWRYLFIQQKPFETARAANVRSLAELVAAVVHASPGRLRN